MPASPERLSGRGVLALNSLIRDLRPGDVNMDSWWCGTTGCIAGHIVWRHGCGFRRSHGQRGEHIGEWFLKRDSVNHNNALAETQTVASAILGLSNAFTTPLFHTDCWPKKFKALWGRAHDVSQSEAEAAGEPDLYSYRAQRKLAVIKELIRAFIDEWKPEVKA